LPSEESSVKSQESRDVDAELNSKGYLEVGVVLSQINVKYACNYFKETSSRNTSLGRGVIENGMRAMVSVDPSRTTDVGMQHVIQEVKEQMVQSFPNEQRLVMYFAFGTQESCVKESTENFLQNTSLVIYVQALLDKLKLGGKASRVDKRSGRAAYNEAVTAVARRYPFSPTNNVSTKTVVPIQGDGNCLFSSVRSALLTHYYGWCAIFGIRLTLHNMKFVMCIK